MQYTDDISIERLTPDARAIATVAEWTYATWGHLSPEINRHSWLAETRANAGKGGVPSVFAAYLNGDAVGTASLVVQDMTVRPALTPWLASVYVCSDARGRGIASALVRRVEQEARDAGLTRFYLYTPDQQRLYRRLGWQAQEDLNYRAEDVTIMTRGLA